MCVSVKQGARTWRAAGASRFFLRAEERGGDARDGAARDESLGVCAETIGGTGDDHALAGGECAQAGAGHFFGRFLTALGAVGLAGDVVELGGGRAGAEDADADAEGTDLLGEAFAEEEVEGFGGGVSGDERQGLKGGGGGNDENVAAAALDHAGKIQAREVDDGGDVYLHHFEMAGEVGAIEIAVGAKSGIVDEQVEVNSLRCGEGDDLVGRGVASEVGGAEFDAGIVLGAEMGGEIFEAIAATCGENEMRAASGQLNGESAADAGGCAGDECPFFAPREHR